MTLPILQATEENDHVLRRPARAVTPEELTAPSTRQTIAEMAAALAETPDGVAIAAPQIGQPLRIFVVSGKVYYHLHADPEAQAEKPSVEELRQLDRVFINPEIIKSSQELVELEEGCLSVRHYFGQVPRHRQVTVRAVDQDGRPFSEGRGGLLAQIFQHEIDHLDGILFTDKARDVEYRPPEEEVDS